MIDGDGRRPMAGASTPRSVTRAAMASAGMTSRGGHERVRGSHGEAGQVGRQVARGPQLAPGWRLRRGGRVDGLR